MKLFSKKIELIISKTNNIKKLSSCFLSYIATHTAAGKDKILYAHAI